MTLDPKIWGPHYWFVLHTIALNYPLYPNETIKKKYYDFIQNLPIFLPVTNIGNMFSELLDIYPVTPYLESRDAFIKWMYFIHNKINSNLGQPEITLAESLKIYYDEYRPKNETNYFNKIRQHQYIFIIIIVLLLLVATWLYRKS